MNTTAHDVKHRYTSVLGHRVFYREAGPADAPAVVLQHGYPTSSRMFRHLIPALADQFHASPRTTWGSGSPPRRRPTNSTTAFDALTDVTEGLLAELGLERYALYVPETDVATDLFEATDRHTDCPFKGDASYWSIRVGDTVSENAVWGYPEPNDGAKWLRGLVAFYWHRVDHWYDETDEVFGHLRDPYHRVDVRPSSHGVRVRIGDTVVAESEHPMVLSETGLSNRFYIPPAAIRMERLSESSTTTHCPYKGQSTYWNFSANGSDASDVAWSYPDTFDDARQVRGYLSFDGNDVTTETL